MVLVCPRCQRTNPNEAVFCHFDGAELRPVQGRDEKQNKRLPHDFIFPSGRHCRTYEDLVRGCHEEWDAARVLLRQGVFRQFLAGAGRADLARAADEAKTQTDPDIALDTFLNSLPATVDERPRLDLNPRRLNLGTLHVGESRQLRLTVTNQGRGRLHGTLTVAGCTVAGNAAPAGKVAGVWNGGTAALTLTIVDPTDASQSASAELDV